MIDHDRTRPRMRWIERVLLSPRRSADPEFAQRVATRLRGLAVAHLRASRVSAASHIVNMHDLPVEVRQGVLADPVFGKVLADPPGAIKMGTICFEQHRYFEAVETAFKQGTASCVSTTALTFDLRYVDWVGARVPGIILALPEGP